VEGGGNGHCGRAICVPHVGLLASRCHFYFSFSEGIVGKSFEQTSGVECTQSELRKGLEFAFSRTKTKTYVAEVGSPEDLLFR
jgi:hypothetical protein